MSCNWLIIISAALVALAIATSHRYEISSVATGADYVGLWRVDNWTGEILYCDRGATGEACEQARIVNFGH